MRDVPLDILYGVAHTDRQGATLGEEAVTEGTGEEVTLRTRSHTMQPTGQYCCKGSGLRIHAIFRQHWTM